MSELALELIRKEKEEKTGKLDIGNCGLRELPKELFECTWLEELNLGEFIDYDPIKNRWRKSKNSATKNKLESLPKSFSLLARLKKLSLNTVGIKDSSSLRNLPKLEWLNLCQNHSLDWNQFPEISQLKFLVIGYSSISDISFVEKLSNLYHLDLRSNQISDIRVLEKLPNLSSLNLSINKKIKKNYSVFKKLINLRHLDLRSNGISDIRFLEKLTSLSSLFLNSNGIYDIRVLEKLPSLSSLSLRANHIRDIGVLEKLPDLRHLNLGVNQISDIRVLEKLSNLRHLNLSANDRIKEYSVLEKLPNLSNLDLGSNRISDIHFLEKLPSLSSLSLYNNEISDIRVLEKLPNLNSLDLDSNQIEDIGVLTKLPSLRHLNFGNNQIKDIGSLSKLPNLSSLYLHYNQITNIKLLLSLVKKGIPVELDEYASPNTINLYENPISIPPLEVIKEGNEAIIKFFEDIERQGKDYLYEAKLLIVGEGESGKTTLAWKLKDIEAPMPKKEDDRTRGIDIAPLEIDNIALPEKPFRMNVWDFGGQEIYHATHQFFLTKRSLYLIVNNTRSNLTDFNHWLQLISLFSDNSPVIIVQNEVAGSPTDLDLRGLQQYFTNVLYVRDTDLSKKDERLKKLIRDIHFQIQQLDHVGSELPKQWVAVRQTLKERAKEEPHISDRAFYKICHDNKITDKDAIQRLGGFLHDLGVFLHFQDDPILKRLVILQNSWATKGVYQILDDPQVKSQNGHFSYNDAISIWQNTPFEDMHDELLQLMSEFELCYRIPYQKPAQYVSPQLLPIEKPDYEWNSKRNLIIYYDYDFMPKGLLGRLIVRLYRYIKDINTLAWRTGCVFTYEDTDAQVIETYGNKKIEVRIHGKDCVRLSSIIIKEIDELNDGFKRLRVKKFIPCNCSVCEASDTPNFYEFQKLLYRKEKKRPTIECDQSFELVSIKGLIEGVYEDKNNRDLSIKELIKQDRLKEALLIFEKTNPDKAILLWQQYNRSEKQFSKGIISDENWTMTRQKIIHSLMEFQRVN